MTAYAETATVTHLPHTPPGRPRTASGSSLQAALNRALETQSFQISFRDQVRRGEAAAEAVTLDLAVRHGSGTVSLGHCADAIVAEGLQSRIDHHAIRSACRYLAGTDSALRATVPVAAETLARPGCVLRIEEAAASAGVEPERLELEIEEHALHWRGDIEPTLEQLAGLGVRIAIDRFGTGLTSLAALAHLPIATIKLDESIVTRVLDDNDVANYARAIIDVARHMRIQVVVVGAASENLRAFFEGAGCRTFQS